MARRRAAPAATEQPAPLAERIERARVVEVQVLPILCVFLAHGRTFTFRNVIVESDNEYAISFGYVAMSDGRRKRATFYKANVAGISTTEG